MCSGFHDFVDIQAALCPCYPVFLDRSRFRSNIIFESVTVSTVIIMNELSHALFYATIGLEIVEISIVFQL